MWNSHEFPIKHINPFCLHVMNETYTVSVQMTSQEDVDGLATVCNITREAGHRGNTYCRCECTGFSFHEQTKHWMLWQ